MQSPHHFAESQPLLESSLNALEQSCPPSLREILAAYKYANGQDGDCQLLIAVLNAKSAEDQRLAAVAKLRTTMLQYQHGNRTPSSPSSSSSYLFPPLHPTSNVSSPRPNSSYRRHHNHHQYDVSPPMGREGDLSANFDPKSTRRSRSRRHSRTPYERPSVLDSSGAHVPLSPYSSRGSDSSIGSPRVRETMAINALLSSPRIGGSGGDDHHKHPRSGH